MADAVRFGWPTSTALTVGDQAPAFELRQTFERSYSRPVDRPLVLAFYVLDFGAI